MPAGAEIINNSGRVLIDSNYSNLCVVAKGVGTFQATATGSGYLDITVSVPNGIAPVMAISSGTLCTVAWTSISGFTFTARILCGQSGVGVTCAYYVFALPSSVPQSYGLFQTYTETGQLAFDSNLEYMRAVGFVPASETWPGFNIPSGRAVAYVPTQPGLRSLSRNENPTPPPFRYVVTDDYVGFAISGGTITRARFITQIQQRTSNTALPEWANSYASPLPALLVIDVTGYL